MSMTTCEAASCAAELAEHTARHTKHPNRSPLAGQALALRCSSPLHTATCAAHLHASQQTRSASQGLRSLTCRHRSTLHLVVLVISTAVNSVQAGLGTGQAKPLAAAQAAEAASCSSANFSSLYSAIDADLVHWKGSGISASLMSRSLRDFEGALGRHKGVAILFQAGIPYIISDPAWFHRIAHHIQLVLPHLALMEALSTTYGRTIPDVEFVIGTGDEPQVWMGPEPAANKRGRSKKPEGWRIHADSGRSKKLKGRKLHAATDGGRDGPDLIASKPPALRRSRSLTARQRRLPAPPAPTAEAVADLTALQLSGKRQNVLRSLTAWRGRLPPPPAPTAEAAAEAALPSIILRFCKSSYHADILVPDIHFQMRAYERNLLANITQFNKAWPWHKKNGTIFGRFSPYGRSIREGATTLYRQGVQGTNICREVEVGRSVCDVRRHMMWTWAKQAKKDGLPIDVAQQPRQNMLTHASYKYLMHLDGQTCSSRLEQLLALGSVVFKEESGYFAFYHHLLKPNTHYLPFWKKKPEDLVEVMDWAQAHDAEAARIAEAAQTLAAQYLHAQALSCYWFTLLQRLAALLTYIPGAPDSGRNYTIKIPVREYLRAEGAKQMRKYRLDTSIELHAPLSRVAVGSE